ncbi:hypothetical protein MGYG_08320 [Nannizzia gypsea CBS 118893]|uniref:Phosphotransferase enzyme family protein n=1 Tax=Arthroderma gypseum (strain ATCC MYA-4604 / CBS 118893) TaxID=535722 RepID=E4V6C6_ARTGP|nr:hypothetical protein MGYG_08320 [Nannizzia gypsea CBS 118893]EFR05309.1 hypothetical protein MGYG_08320 [Nannizzia gypsea CBS 118893]
MFFEALDKPNINDESSRNCQDADVSKGLGRMKGSLSTRPGRFLFNEQRRLEERRVEFDVDALKRAAETHLGRGKITSLTKLAEGGVNRVFLLTTEDGFQAIAKIPYKITVPNHYTTASEVATTDFLRSKGIPVPYIFGWSADPNNPVGVEYIIMEKASGIPLETKWFNLSKDERLPLVTSLVDIEKKLFAIPFGHFGSIYYRTDVPSDLQQDLYIKDAVSSADERFCIGPTADYMFWYGKRAELEVDRGPWKTPSDYLTSIGKREYEWTLKYGKPRPVRFPHVVNFEGINSPDDHIRLLSQYWPWLPTYLVEIPTEISTAQPCVTQILLLETYLYARKHTRSRVLSIGNMLLCLHCSLPRDTLQCFRALIAPPPRTLEKPTLPDNYDSLSPDQKLAVDEIYRRRALHYIYMAFTGGLNEPHLAGMTDPRVLVTQHLVERAEKKWSGDIFSLKGALIRIKENWDCFNERLPEPIPCPISFPESEITGYYEQEQTWFEMNLLVEHWKSELQGVNDDGWVRAEAYDEAVQKNAEIKQGLLNDSDTEEERQYVLQQWPSQDHEEDPN